jgi:hypothetical protein
VKSAVFWHVTLCSQVVSCHATRRCTPEDNLETSAMEKSSWKAINFSPSEEISHILWCMKLHYCVHKSLPPVPVVSPTNPVLALPSYFFKIRF